jgi:hypothetical protein
MTRSARTRTSFGVLIAAAVLVTTDPPGARAQGAAVETKRVCATAAETAQRLRARGLLSDARAELRVCSREDCPAAVRADCQQWLAEIDRAQPTPPSSDTPQPAPPRLVPAPSTAPTPASAAAPPEPAPAAAPQGAALVPLAWFGAGISLIALGSFAYFGATGTSDLNRLRDQCAGHCAQSDVDAAWNKLVAADISLAVGVVSGGIAGWLFFQAARSTHDGPATEPHLGVALRPGGVEAAWKVRF